MNARDKFSQRLKENGGITLSDLTKFSSTDRAIAYQSFLDDLSRVYRRTGQYILAPSVSDAPALDFMEGLARVRIACHWGGETESTYLSALKETENDLGDDETAEPDDIAEALELVA